MSNDYQILLPDSPTYAQETAHLLGGGRPLTNARVKTNFDAHKHEHPPMNNARGLQVNSILRRDEWVVLDTDVISAAVQPLNVANLLIQNGLVGEIRDIGQVVAQYNRSGEMTAANTSMRMHASGEKDLVDFDLAGVPIPIIFKEYELDTRLLRTGRLMGNDLDTANAGAAARVVAEKVEDIVLNGDTSINLNGQTIYGLTNFPYRTTDTAANFGGGSWTTATNPPATVAGMISALQGKGFYGPYGIIAANAQFNAATFNWFSDVAQQTPAERIRQMGQGSMNQQIKFFEPSAQLPSGTVVMFQLTKDVIELRRLAAMWPVTNIEWSTGDNSLNKFKVMTVMTILIKAAYGNKSGVVVATGA
jgi:hypothetical protein